MQEADSNNDGQDDDNADDDLNWLINNEN